MSKQIRVIIADDHALVLKGLSSLLAAEDDIRVLATATDGERLLEAVRRYPPDVVIADIQMPYIDGIACIEHIRRANLATRVLLLTANPDGETMQAVLAAGADGLLLKTDRPELVVQAVRQVMAGQLVYPAAARRWLMQPEPSPAPILFPLSEREVAVLRLVANGHTNSEVAAQLHISENTVKHHLKNIYRQLGVANRTEAGSWFHQNQRMLPSG